MDNPAAAATDRVERFMTEYAAQWQIAAPAFDRSNQTEESVDRFGLWRGLMAETIASHFTATTHVDLAGSFGSPAEYGPEQATIVRTDVVADVAHVLARRNMRIERYHEYTLQLVDGDWRIVAIEDHSSDPSDPFGPRSEVDQRVQECSSDAPLAPMPDEQAHLDEVHNFTTRQVTNHDGEPESTLVEPIGTLVTTSGVLSVLDFGYDNDDARPLARTVPPGSYPVDRLTWDGRTFLHGGRLCRPGLRLRLRRRWLSRLLGCRCRWQRGPVGHCLHGSGRPGR